MSGLSNLLSGTSSFLNPFKPDPFQTHWVSGIVYKLHSMTGGGLFIACCLVFVKELTGDHINCIHDGSDAIGSLVRFATCSCRIHHYNDSIFRYQKLQWIVTATSRQLSHCHQII